MKCPHCNQEHLDNPKFCPKTGAKMMLCCRNYECENFGEYVIPINYKFCPECGSPLFCPHCEKNTCDCDTEKASKTESKTRESSSSLRKDNALIIVYNEDEDNEYCNSDNEPKIVKVFSMADGTPKLVHQGIYRKPETFDVEKEKGHDVLELRHWEEFKFDEISVLGIKKNLDYSQTIKEQKNDRRDDERCERQGFEVLSENFLLKRSYSDDNYVDLYDRKTRRILLKKAIDNKGVYVRRDWCLIAGNDGEDWDDDIRTLVHKEHKIQLRPAEDVLDALDAWTDSEKDAFISENRIISCVELYSGIYEEINIRDYQGKLIKSIKKPNIYIKQPYRFGKALGFRMNDLSPTGLIYFDMSGNIHNIPYSVDHICNAYKSRCWFVTDNTVFIKSDHSDYPNELIDLEGNVLFDAGEGHINYLGDNYLEYYDYDEGKCGVIDGHGNIVLKPEFDDVWWGVLR